MRLLKVISSADPQGGGPIESVRQTNACLRELGHEVEILSLDDPAAPFLRDYPYPIHALGPAAGSYSYTGKLVPWLHANAARFEGVVVHGLWGYHSFGTWRAMRRLGRPYFIFTHGMLDPWFKHTYPLKHLKKWLYWPWAEYRVLRDAQQVLFTCEDEKLLARQSFWLYQANERVVAYGTRTPPQDADRLREAFLTVHPQLRGKRLLLFLSRIHEKKGCDLLIEAFARVAAEQPGLHLVMAGPDQTGWVPALKAQALALGVADRITWPGMLQGDLKWGAFHASEAFVLPSHQENFGIAVAEALGCGLPVLISDKVNIWREIERDGAGFVGSDDLLSTVKTLQRWLSSEPAVRQQMAVAARHCFQHRFTVDVMTESLLHALEGAPSSRAIEGQAV